MGNGRETRGEGVCAGRVRTWRGACGGAGRVVAQGVCGVRRACAGHVWCVCDVCGVCVSVDGERERETDVRGWGRAHGAVPSVCTAPCK